MRFHLSDYMTEIWGEKLHRGAYRKVNFTNRILDEFLYATMHAALNKP